MSIGTMTFAGAGLDRADHIRADADKLAELMDWRARLLRLDGLDPQITPEGALEWGSLADADPARISAGFEGFLRDGIPAVAPLFGDGHAAERICDELIRSW